MSGSLTPSLPARTHPRRLLTRIAVPGALLILAAVIYWWTIDTGLQPYELHGGDLITHQYAQVQARPSNAPGYPLYTMGGWLWFHLWRSVAVYLGASEPNPLPILSSYSTAYALLALWLVYQVICEITRTANRPYGNRPVAFLSATFYAATYFFWYYATTTEQYSSAIAHTLAILYVYLLWARDPKPGYLRLFLLAFLCGLTLAHMLTVAFIVPPLVLAILWQCPGLMRDFRAILGSIAAATMPLLAYLYVYLRGALHPEWWGAESWSDANAWFWNFVSTAQGRQELLWGLEPGRPLLGNGFPELVWREFSVVLLVFGLIGIARLGRKLAFVAYGTLTLYVIFCWFYRFGNWFQVILPAYPLIIIGLAKFANDLQPHVPGETRKIHESNCRHRRWKAHSASARRAILLSLLPLVVLAVATIWRAAKSFPAVDSRERSEDTALARATALLHDPLPPGTGLFATVDDALALQYLTRIWQIQPDLSVIDRRAAAERLRSGDLILVTPDAWPTLFSELASDLQMAVAVESASFDWLAVYDPAIYSDTRLHTVTHLPQVHADLLVVPGIRLRGVRADYRMPDAGSSPALESWLDVILYWELLDGDWPSDLSISVRPMIGDAYLIDENQNGTASQIVQSDSSRPARGHFQYPQEGDHAAERTRTPVADAYRLDLTDQQLSEVNRLHVIVYRRLQDGFENVAETVVALPH